MYIVLSVVPAFVNIGLVHYQELKDMLTEIKQGQYNYMFTEVILP